MLVVHVGVVAVAVVGEGVVVVEGVAVVGRVRVRVLLYCGEGRGGRVS